MDDAARSQAVRAQLGLDFTVLCDPARSVVRAWDLYNPREMGGIAVPAVFVIDRNRRVRYRSIDSTRARVDTQGVLGFLRDASRDAPRVNVRATFGDFGRAIANALRRGGRQPGPS